MAQLSRALIVCVAICVTRQTAAQTRADAAPFALTHLTVIDVANGRSRPDQTLVVIGNRIARLGPSGRISVPSGARIIDARGRFVIPGLWDMHVHLFSHSADTSVDVHERYFPLFLANGVTGVRDMWTTVEDFQTVRRWRRDEAAGTLLGPRVMGSSTPLDGVPPIWPRGSIGIKTVAEARRVVDSLVRGGAEFIKVYTRLPRDAYFAIVGESKRLGVPFAGHLPLSIRAAEASDAGQKSIEHLGFRDDCSAARDRIVQLRQDTTLARPEGGIESLVLETYSDSLCAALFRRFVTNGTWQVPTLSALWRSTLAFDTLMLDPHLRYATDEERTAWSAQTRATSQRTTPRQAEVRRHRFQNALDILAGMQRAGVPILAGTDVGNPWLIAGFSLQDELAIFGQAGMPPLAALQTATINPARYFGALDSLGTIAAGKIADLVLLDGNPLKDVRNTRRIRAVVANGRFLTRAALDSLLSAIRGNAVRR